MLINFPAPVFGFLISTRLPKKKKIIGKFQGIFRLPKRLSRIKYKNKERYYVLLQHKLYRARVAQPGQRRWIQSPVL
jgi:hypothetical protein